jgi:putative zinc finger protein
VRHIPEDELHAYLDQALSRSQCVEIERHLARCPRCQASRDSIAALRDRTTALLARVGPPPIIPPAFETLMARAAARQQRRWRWIKAGAWAASVSGVLVLGWWMSGRLFRVEPHATLAVSPPVVTSRDVPQVATVPSAASAPARVVARPKPRPEAGRPTPQLVRASRPVGVEAPAATGFALATEVDPQPAIKAAPAERLTIDDAPTFELHDLAAQPVGDAPGLNGLWRTIVPDNNTDRKTDIALVPGLPVLQMRVQPGNQGDDVTAVDQTLESGEMIRTISGPATRVLALVNEDAAADTARLDANPSSMTVTIRQADRMVAVTGPANALGSLLARVNIKNGKRRY